jgi:hypothetical protein
MVDVHDGAGASLVRELFLYILRIRSASSTQHAIMRAVSFRIKDSNIYAYLLPFNVACTYSRPTHVRSDG